MNRRALLSCSMAVALAMTSAQNPYLPLWEFIPDGEPYVFEDPDNPGKYRVYVYGSHDNLVTEYCGKDQVVWSASVDNLQEWRLDGIIFESKRDAKGNLLHPDGSGDVLYAPDVVETRDADKIVLNDDVARGDGGFGAVIDGFAFLYETSKHDVLYSFG